MMSKHSNLFIQKEFYVENLHKRFIEEAFGKTDFKIINKILPILNLDTGNKALKAYVIYRVESWSTPQMKNKILSLYECSQNLEHHKSDNSLDELLREPQKETKRALKKEHKNISKNTPLSALIFSNSTTITASEQERNKQIHEPESEQEQPKERFGLHFS